MSPGEFRLRICFAKQGRLRWLSHLEVLRALERTVRRSGLPYAVTHGFNPHMKAAFGPALPVGVEGRNEYADVWLTRYTVASEVLERLKQAAVEDLAPTEVRYVGDKDPSITAVLTIAHYVVEVDGKEIEASDAHAALERVLRRGELVIEHRGKTKVYDLTRSVPKDPRVEATEQGVRVELSVRMGPQGSLRPEALVRAALTERGLTPSAVRTTRLDLLVEGENGVWSRPV